ncbi:MAG: signal peptidase I [Firmicutes bacterium]|nr:signal peptidase I [Bacillota bacterium]
MLPPSPPDQIHEPQPPKKRKTALTRIISLVLWLLIILLIAFIIFFNVFSLVRVQGVSMHYTLQDGQHVLLLRTNRIRRGDIIVYRGINQNIIKRVIGIGGDQLLFAREPGGETLAFIKINGRFEIIDEDYLSTNNRFFDINQGQLFNIYERSSIANISNPHHIVPERYIISIREHEYFVLGDNRRNSIDSRNTGLVHSDNILGRVSSIVTKESSLESFLLFIYGGRTDQSR